VENIVVFENVSFYYVKEKIVIKNFSLTLEKGKYYGIYGKNGIGKSTLAKLLVGLALPKRGTLTINGLKMNQDNIATIQKMIGIVFQNPDNQFVGATVEDDIAFGLENRNIPYQEMHDTVLEYANKLQITDLLDSDPVLLSGGQKQRVAIAGILALHPDILILDEATSMLDPLSKLEFRNALKTVRLLYPDITIINITHEVEDMYDFDNIIVLDNAHLAFSGTLSELLEANISINLPFEYTLQNKLKEKGINVDSQKIVEDLWTLYSKK
jgi:energy-coupling factor transport system ATP-binding protein